MSFGAELKRERELREISLREVAEATKISLRHLEALERNDFEQLPGGVFNRGFVRAFSEHIGVDPESMVNAYLLEERTRAGERPADHEPFQRGKGHNTLNADPALQGRADRRKIFLATLLAVLAAGLLGIVVWYVVWGRSPAGTGSVSGTTARDAALRPTVSCSHGEQRS